MSTATKYIGEVIGDLNLEGLPHWMEELDPSVYLDAIYLVMDLETTNKDYGSALNPDNELVALNTQTFIIIK